MHLDTIFSGVSNRASVAAGPAALKLPSVSPLTLFANERVQEGVGFMVSATKKCWLGATLLLFLVPSSFALQRDGDHPRHDKCEPGDQCQQQVPEGGSAAIYLLGAGLTCLGAMLFRSRSSKFNLS
jgi:hypothetical protein